MEEEHEVEDKPVVQLEGTDGNAFMILGKCLRVARKAQWSQSRIDMVTAEMKAGDYDHLLQTAMKYFEVE